MERRAELERKIKDTASFIREWERDLDRERRKLATLEAKLAALEAGIKASTPTPARLKAAKRKPAAERLRMAKAYLGVQGIRYFCDKRQGGHSLKPVTITPTAKRVLDSLGTLKETRIKRSSPYLLYAHRRERVGHDVVYTTYRWVFKD